MSRAALCLAGVLTLASSLESRAASDSRAAGAPQGCVLFGTLLVRDRAAYADEQLAESQHFVVSYCTSGPDSILRPDIPEILLEDLESAYGVLSTDPRAAMHPPLGTYEVPGEAAKILVRVGQTNPGFRGHAVVVRPSAGDDVPCDNSTAGYIIVSYRLRSRGEARRLAAHELMHLFQYAMDAYESPWVVESTASWAEAFVFPESRSDVQSWPSILQHQTSIWSTSQQSKQYSPHFWDFLDQIMGEAIPPALWANACKLDWFEALQQTLTERGVDLDEMLHEYAIWNYYTGSRDDGSHYPYPNLPEVVPDASFTRYPVLEVELDGPYAQEAASNHLFFAGVASRENLRVRFHGSSEAMAHRKVAWIGTTGSNTHDESASVSPTVGEFVVPDWYKYDQVAVVVTNGVNGNTIRTEDLRYTVSAIEEGGSVADVVWRDSRAMLRSTNPGQGGVAIRYRSSGVAHRTQVVIYDARGRIVRAIVDGVLPAGDYGAYWDGATVSGSRAAAGMYVVVLKQNGMTVPSRFILLR